MADTSTLDRAAELARLTLAIGSPSAFYMTGEDGLQLSGWNITAGVRLTVSGRFLQLDGRVQSFTHDVALTTDRVIASVVRSLGEGWLLNLTVTTGATSSPFGQTFARVQVIRGLAASGAVLGTLCAGAVSSAQPIAYPGAGVRSMVEGRGSLRSITGTNPAAGVAISETVPTGARWRFIGILFTFVTDATAANREVALSFDDGAAEFLRLASGQTQAATLTFRYNFASHLIARAVAQANIVHVGTPDLILLAGYRIQAVTTNIQAGDDFAAPQLIVEEWLDAP